MHTRRVTSERSIGVVYRRCASASRLETQERIPSFLIAGDPSRVHREGVVCWRAHRRLTSSGNYDGCTLGPLEHPRRRRRSRRRVDDLLCWLHQHLLNFGQIWRPGESLLKRGRHRPDLPVFAVANARDPTVACWDSRCPLLEQLLHLLGRNDLAVLVDPTLDGQDHRRVFDGSLDFRLRCKS